ncbi:MAG: peptide/nickel transport system permease protein [Thermoanaerobaculia bacterium]|jgi:peptide/nickel transport system permease protein|nr:peptide/nickel transport system permease protein [Thermoanaerobaculia bacterium]
MKRTTRILGYVVVVWLGATANFLLPRLLPGDPVDFLIGDDAGRLTSTQRTAILAQFGMDQPLLKQYGRYLSGLARLDLGNSLGFGEPVLKVVAARLPWTLLLVGSAIVLAFVIGFILACLFHWVDSARTSSTLMSAIVFFGSLPPFWLGMVAIAVFAVSLGWLPTHGAAPLEGGLTLSGVLRHALLPVATLTLGYIPSVFLVARAALEGALGEGYVALARSHGASPMRVLLRQAAPVAMLPLVNQFAMSFGVLLGGTVIVETVFAYPGLGLLLYEGILALDFPLVQGVFLLLVFSVVLANIAADLLQTRLDPRVRGGLEVTP